MEVRGGEKKGVGVHSQSDPRKDLAAVEVVVESLFSVEKRGTLNNIVGGILKKTGRSIENTEEKEFETRTK